MRSVFEPSETLVLLDAQERVIDQLSDDFVITDTIKWTVANIVLRIGSHRQANDLSMIAAEIAMDAVLILLDERAHDPNSAATIRKTEKGHARPTTVLH